MDGGTNAWVAGGFDLEKGMPAPAPYGIAEARAKVRSVTPEELQGAQRTLTLFVDTSQDFARGHVHGARWVPRGSLELQVGEFAPSQMTPIAVTCSDGGNSTLAGASLMEMGYQDVSVLGGGMAAWHRAGLPVEEGLSGVMSAPTDMVSAGPDRNFADRINYLRWETALGEKYAS